MALLSDCRYLGGSFSGHRLLAQHMFDSVIWAALGRVEHAWKDEEKVARVKSENRVPHITHGEIVVGRPSQLK